MADDEFTWDGQSVVTPDGYEADLVAMHNAGAGGVLVVVRPPWARPFTRFFTRSPQVDREAERLIRAHRAAGKPAPMPNATGSHKLH